LHKENESKESAADHSPLHCWFDNVELPCAAHRERATSESRIPCGDTPPSRSSVLYSAARRREMAKNLISWLLHRSVPLSIAVVEGAI